MTANTDRSTMAGVVATGEVTGNVVQGPSYAGLDVGTVVHDFPPQVEVRVGTVASGPSGRFLHFEPGTVPAPTIEGASIDKAETYINERRILVVSKNSQTDNGVLNYTAVVKPNCAVGDHSHFERSERIIVLYGRVTFRLLDTRKGRNIVNEFTIDDPGLAVIVPVEVVHSVLAEGGLAVLHVIANRDYEPGDDVHVQISNAVEG